MTRDEIGERVKLLLADAKPEKLERALTVAILVLQDEAERRAIVKCVQIADGWVRCVVCGWEDPSIAADIRAAFPHIHVEPPL